MRFFKVLKEILKFSFEPYNTCLNDQIDIPEQYLLIEIFTCGHCISIYQV